VSSKTGEWEITTSLLDIKEPSTIISEAITEKKASFFIFIIL
jgi:hypothetical protein